MASYAALASLLNILNRIQNPHPHHIFLKKIQTSTLFDQVSFLLDFVEVYSQKRSNEIKVLERQIVDAAYATECLIESYIMDQIHSNFAWKKDRRYATFCKNMQKKIRKMNLIEKKVMKIKLVDDDDKNFNEKNSHSRIEASGTSSIAKPPGGKKNSTFEVHIMNLIKKVARKIKLADDDKHLNEKNPISRIEAHAAAGSSSINNANEPPAGGGKKKSTMVGFEEDLKKLMKLLCIRRSDRLIIPIVGMGGIGKTTLARNTYDNPFIISHFIIRAWVTLSPKYSVREIILGLLYDISVFIENPENNQNIASFTKRMRGKSDEQLGEQLHKSLFGRIYLIVLDDIWSTSAWDAINKFLPDNSNYSRIMMTTRLSALALSLGSSLNYTYAMKFLEDDKSWNLLSEKVFSREQICPPELEKFGRLIAKNCRGLPLAIVVIGGLLKVSIDGLLKVSNKTKKYWENVAENVNSIVNTENDDNCLKILSLSYNELPIHLKPLFLYMATFPEDSEIRVSKLIKLWVSEGFLKPTINDQTLEEVAMEHLKDLIDRNLIMVQKRGLTGNIKTCHIHDLVRDLCLREAKNERFICVTRMYELDIIPQIIEAERRLCVHRSTNEKEDRLQVLNDLRSMSLAREKKVWRRLHVLLQSTSREKEYRSYLFIRALEVRTKSPRVLEEAYKYLYGDIQQVANARYIEYSRYCGLKSSSLSSIFRLWNLETLIVDLDYMEYILPSEIWEMPHLRHLKFRQGEVHLPDPPPVDGDDQINYCVLNNLQTLHNISNFRWDGKVLCRIPNLKKLKISYSDLENGEVTYCLNNLVHFHKLEILHCSFFSYYHHCSIRTLSFPPNLKKLVLRGCRIPWENMSIIGSLPNLEVLKLLFNAFVGSEWNSVEGEFQCLKFLSIYGNDLKIWRAESSNFPTLEHLVIDHCDDLEEIPWGGIGEIPTLQTIKLHNCKKSVVFQANNMLKELQLQGNEDLHLHIHVQSWTRISELQSLASDNFHVDFIPGSLEHFF